MLINIIELILSQTLLFFSLLLKYLMLLPFNNLLAHRGWLGCVPVFVFFEYFCIWGGRFFGEAEARVCVNHWVHNLLGRFLVFSLITLIKVDPGDNALGFCLNLILWNVLVNVTLSNLLWSILCCVCSFILFGFVFIKFTLLFVDLFWIFG